jgi:LPXTG-motif cell wall-anchored protein
MEKISEVVYWIAVGVLGLFMVGWILTRGLGSLVTLVLLFVHSPLPWWILTLAAIALVAGFVYLFRRRRTRIGPNQKFVN